MKKMKKITEISSLNSITSMLFPWRLVHQRPVLTIGNQTGREVTPVNFFLCLSSVMLLCTGVGLSSASLWGIIHKIPYMYIATEEVPLYSNITSLCSGIISIACCWIACTTHNSQKNYVFLPLLMVLLGFCLSMLAVGMTMALLYKSQINFKKNTIPPILQPGIFRNRLNQTMYNSMVYYENNLKNQYAWEAIQNRLICCGTNSFKDWRKLPSSCCYLMQCNNRTIHKHGCLNKVAYDLMWEICLNAGLSFITVLVQTIALIISSATYIQSRLHVQNSETDL